MDEGANAIANGSLTSLTFLDLDSNCIGAEGANALANGHLTSLTSLNLRSNQIMDEGVNANRRGTSILSPPSIW
jgi:hypothetical protein